MLARFERCRQDQRAHNVSLAVERREFGARQLGAVLISDRNPLSGQVASMRARDEGPQRQLGPDIDFARRKLDRAGALTVRPNCLCGHISP
jgi:hypothetical protein